MTHYYSLYKILTVLMVLQITGCADLSYYLHSVKGQLSIMQQTREIDEVLQDESTQSKLREQLTLVSRIRQFAFTKLDLPESDSYTEYADLGRPYVLKNLFASAEFSIVLQRWCYPIAGCAGYRGYFDEERLQGFKAKLEQQGKDVYVANIPAYSTLGWFDDPVLNTFIYWPEYRLAGLIFHELAHQRLYIDGDTSFNESFATAVQQTAVEKWLEESNQFAKLAAYKLNQKNRRMVFQLIESGRQQLNLLYESKLTDSLKRTKKYQLLQKLKNDYRQLSAKFTVKDGFSNWFNGQLNNAKLASVSTYHSSTGAFRNMLKYYQGDYSEFYRQVEKISRMDKVDRYNCLDLWDLFIKKQIHCR